MTTAGAGINMSTGTTVAEIDVDQLRLMFEDWPHAVFAIDRAGQYAFQNAVDRAAFGDLDDKVADDVGAEAASDENWSDAHRRVLAGETITYTVSRSGDGGAARDAEVTMSPLRKGREIIGILGMSIDRSDAARFQREREAASALLHATYTRLERLTNNVPGGIFEFVIGADGSMFFPYVSSGMGPMLGTTTEALLEDHEAGFAHDHPDDAALVRQAIERSHQTLEPVKITHRLNHPDQGLRWHHVHATPTRQPDGSVIWHGSIFDITEERARAEELENARNRMQELSHFDSLTGLPNRRAIGEHMASRFANPDLRDSCCTVIRVDLDHFKTVNDTLGHAAGDAVLCRVGQCLVDATRDGDFSARLGGDEFVVILAPDRTLADAEGVIDRLRALIDMPFMHQGRHCHFNASFGVASVATLPDDHAELLASADAALLHAKAQGRGRTAIFTDDLQQAIVHRRRRAAQIRIALERQEFVPFFQPQIDAATGEIAGFEVLARWQHAEEGTIVPAEFIPVAEQMRVVQDIDRMMFAKALEVLDRLKADGFHIPKLSFNVSASRVHDPDIVQSVRQLQTNGTRVGFELLESILLEEENAIFAHHIDLIKECGVDIEVDDFGSGHASIIGVLKVAPDTLKIDRRLVGPLLESERARGLLRAIIDIGHSLEIDITAEGVETMPHALALRKMGCKTLQGYAFAHPMPESVMRSYLASFRPVFARGEANRLSIALG